MPLSGSSGGAEELLAVPVTLRQRELLVIEFILMPPADPIAGP